ncbi:MAG: tetratricopeptide repeat protein [Kiritimatiellales bacterium]
MKLFRKKTVRSPVAHPLPADTDSSQSFYSQYAGEAPLDEYSAGASGHQTRRTSRHSSTRMLEPSNRAGSWAIALLLLRAVLIVLLLVGGFIVLRLVLDRMADPSEKEQQQWQENTARMEKDTAPAGGAVLSEMSTLQEGVISPALIEQRLNQWQQTEQILRSADALSRKGINEEAVQRLGQALRITPDNRFAQRQLVDIYMQQGLFAEAVPLCIRLLDQDSRQQDLQMILLQALQKSGQIETELVLANRILREQPNNQTVLSIAATGQMEKGNAEAALALFEQMLQNNDKNKDALEGCGKIYVAQRDWQKVVPYYLELVQLDPQADYYQTLACCYAQQNQADKAVAFMGQAASLFGEATVAPWLKDPVFDPVRESVEFRSFADRVVGIETRKAIEAISKREAEKAAPEKDGGLELPPRPELNVIRPNK